MIVEPTNLNPNFLSFKLISSEILEVAGILEPGKRLEFIGLWFTCCHKKLVKLPGVLKCSKYILELIIMALIFRRFLTMPGLFINSSTLALSYFETIVGSKLSKALRKFSLLFKIIAQDSPAC